MAVLRLAAPRAYSERMREKKSKAVTVHKASGFKDKGGNFWVNETGKYGCRYQCKTCGKITLGYINSGKDFSMHYSACAWFQALLRPLQVSQDPSTKLTVVICLKLCGGGSTFCNQEHPMEHTTSPDLSNCPNCLVKAVKYFEGCARAAETRLRQLSGTAAAES